MRSAFILGLVALAGCASSPAYRSPALHLPVSFREASDTSGSTPHAVTPHAIARESTDQAPPPRSDYWEQLGDTTLNRLIAEVARANQDIQAAEARVRATRSERVRTLLDLTPDTRLTGSYARQRLSSSTFPGFAGSTPGAEAPSIPSARRPSSARRWPRSPRGKRKLPPRSIGLVCWWAAPQPPSRPNWNSRLASPRFPRSRRWAIRKRSCGIGPT